MKLELLSLQINNFKSIAKLQFKLDRPVGVHLICGDNQVDPDLGSNGAGKSTLWDAICWCFYGKTPDGLRSPDLIPWGTNTEVIVRTDVQLDGSERHTPIVRGANPNFLNIDGKTVSQEQLEQTIGMNFDTFTNTMLLGQGRPLFFDLTPTAKMQLFSDALNLDRWERRSKEASKKATDLQSHIDETNGRLTANDALNISFHVPFDVQQKREKEAA